MSPTTWFRAAGLCAVVVLAGVFVLPDAAGQDKGKRYALLVGVTEYKREPFTKLNYTENDVEELAKILKKSGFEVRVLTNTRGKAKAADAATTANILAEIRALVRDKERDDTILVALSGHGVAMDVPDPEGKEKTKVVPFFCPHDADLADISYSKEGNDFLINLNKLFTDLGSSGAGVKLVLMDACRDEMKAQGVRRNVAGTKLDVPKGLGALFSCSAEEKAFETPDLKHGVFFHFVLEGLRGGAARNGEVTFDDLVSYVVGKVADGVPVLIKQGARQTPDRIITYKGKSPVLARVEAVAGDDLRVAFAGLAAGVKKALDAEKVKEIAITKFYCENKAYKSGAGSGFIMMLGEELMRLGVTVKENAKYGVEGSYSTADVDAVNPDDANIGKKILAVKLRVEVFEVAKESDKPDFVRKVLNGGGGGDERVVRGEALVARVFGANVPLSPANTNIQNDGRLRDAIIEKSSCHVDGSVVQSAKDQPYALEVLVNGKARTARESDGQAFVDIQRGEAYTLRLTNHSLHEAAAGVFIDGISVYAFSQLKVKEGPRKGEPRYSAIIVPAAKNGKPGTAVVSGWHKNNDRGGEESFVVTEYAKSAAASLKRTEGLGTITVTFQAAWEKDPPKDEPGKRRGGLGDATGFGPPTGGGFREVSRTLGVVRDCVTVRYVVAK